MSVAPTVSDEEQMNGPRSVSADIRALRKSRSMTLAHFAKQLGRSVGFVSQLERDLSEPSINDLRKIADTFNVPISFFFGPTNSNPQEARHIVRAGERRRLGNPSAGLVEELLSPDLGGVFEVVRSEFSPGSGLVDPIQRNTEEAGFVVSGTLDIEINAAWYTLHEGDSFRMAGEYYRWRNTGETAAVLVWVVSPPVY